MRYDRSYARRALLRLVTSAALAMSPFVARAQTAQERTPTDSNIVFGNVADAALLMDVYRPAHSNGRGIVFISGSGWGSSPGYTHDYDDTPLKDDAREVGGYIGTILQRLQDAGFTVFAINHRFTPETRFPGPFYDTQRAVRYIRAHAASYGINAERLGAIGHSSGGHLAAMLGVVDTSIVDSTGSPSQRGSSRVQAVVTLAAPFLITELNARSIKLASNLIGPLPARRTDGTYTPTSAVVAASPALRVTRGAAPMLMYQAKDDPIVLPTSAPQMSARLAAAGVPNKLVMRPTGKHAPAYDVAEVVAWFTRYLK